MRKLALAMIAAGGLLSACVLVPEGDGRYSSDGRYYGEGRYYGDRYREGVNRDRDGDGVPNRQDRRPDDPRRY